MLCAVFVFSGVKKASENADLLRDLVKEINPNR